MPYDNACMYYIYMHTFQPTGVRFVIGRNIHYFRGTVSVVSADNPASAALGGFKQSASAFRFCRHCLGGEDVQSKVHVYRRLICSNDFY